MAAIVCDGIFSDLPDDIAQKILSCLTLKQRAIASLVSTKWLHMIASLDDRKFVQTHSTNRYCCYCNKHKLRFCSNCSILHPVIIKFAPDNTSLTEFYLFVPTSSPFLQLSTATLDSRLLTVLHLKYCNIHYENYIKEFPCLKEIYFDSVRLFPITFSNLINNCPSIVELTLIDCPDLYSISVPHLNQLIKVHVNGSRFEKLEIKARNLRVFHLYTSSSSLENLDLCACTKIQVLKIDCGYIHDGFQEFCSAFPRLPASCPVVSSSLMEADIRFKYVHATNRFGELRNATEKLGENIILSMKEVVISHWGNCRSNIEPLFIKHINLEILCFGVPRYESLIDELFSFCPRTLLVRVNSDELYSFIQFLLDELKDWEKESEMECGNRYKYSNHMSWRHFLKGFKILKSTTREENLEFQWRLQ